MHKFCEMSEKIREGFFSLFVEATDVSQLEEESERKVIGGRNGPRQVSQDGPASAACPVWDPGHEDDLCKGHRSGYLGKAPPPRGAEDSGLPLPGCGTRVRRGAPPGGPAPCPGSWAWFSLGCLSPALTPLEMEAASGEHLPLAKMTEESVSFSGRDPRCMFSRAELFQKQAASLSVLKSCERPLTGRGAPSHMRVTGCVLK